MVGTLVRDLKFLIQNRKDFTIIGLDESNTQIMYVKDMDGFWHKTHRTSLMKGGKLSQKSVMDRNGYYINKLKKVHGDKYDYSKVTYINKDAKITIICPEHGEFIQRGSDHMYGAGCPKCAFRLRKGYTKTQWIKYCKKYKHLVNIIYIIRCYNEEEEFIKIGLTSKSVKERFSGLFDIPYKYEILKQYKYIPGKAFDKEKELHRLYSKFKYKPKINFGGVRECFSIDIVTDFIT